MSEFRVSQLRASLVWLRAFPNLLDGSAADVPMAFLGSRDAYIERFDAIQHELKTFVQTWEAERAARFEEAIVNPGERAQLFRERVQAYRTYTRDVLHLTPPWDWMQPNYVHHFWDRYLGLKRAPLSSVDGARAWDARVPLRAVPPFQIRAPWLDGGIIIDGLLYPHAVGLAFMVNLVNKQKGWTIQELMQKMFEVRADANFEVVFPNKTFAELSLDNLANAILNDLLERVFGKKVPPTREIESPLSVVTFFRVEGFQPQEKIGDRTPEHRMFHGLATWDADWQVTHEQNLPPLAFTNIAYDRKRPGDVLHHSPRGRVVWFPTLMNKSNDRAVPDVERTEWNTPGSAESTSVKKKKRGGSLSCYHRNLTLLVAQTEALALAASLVSADLAAAKTPNAALSSYARESAERARDLYLRKKTTYRSSSPEAHLNENSLEDVKLMDIVMKARDLQP